MARTPGSISLASSIEGKMGSALDGRMVCATKADLTASGSFPYPFIGLITSVQSEGKLYMLTGSDPTVESNWKEIGADTSDGSTMLTGTLAAASWSSETQTVTVQGVKADSIGVIGLLNTATTSQYEAAQDAGIKVTTVAANAITFTCEETPLIDIPFGVLITG